MLTIDCTLESFSIPGFINYPTPLFGTKKPDGDPINSREAALNIAMPFSRQRPFVIVEDSETTAIEANTVFDIQTAGSVLNLSPASFNGCLVKIINSSNGVVKINYDDGKESYIESCRSLYLEFINEWCVSYSGDKTGLALPPGMLLYTAMNDVWRAKCRILILEGQLVDISLSSPYYSMGEAIYIGDANNDNPAYQGFYKCDSEGSRNIEGNFMVLPDARGLFLRAAGQNSKYKMANDTPYDGKSIGEFIGDKIQAINGDFFYVPSSNPMSAGGAFASNDESSELRLVPDFSGTGFLHLYQITFNSFRTTRSGNETNPASVSAYVCIKY